MRSSESDKRWRRSPPVGLIPAALLTLGLASCIALPGDDRNAPLQSALAPSDSAGSWIQRQQLQFSAGLGKMREQVDGALGGARDGAGDALRRMTSRAIVASDACFSADEKEGCAVAARMACQRASYTDGAPLASSTYTACSGVWGMHVADAPEGVCKTKRRLNAALCW